MPFLCTYWKALETTLSGLQRSHVWRTALSMRRDTGGHTRSAALLSSANPSLLPQFRSVRACMNSATTKYECCVLPT
jgi:hypothetical protein